MAHALVLSASSLGRSSQPTSEGVLLLVDGDNPVTIDAWPQPARWVPQTVRLYQGDREVRTRSEHDDLRWEVSGADRFGTYRAVATDGERAVASTFLMIRPAPKTVVLPDTAAAQRAASPAADLVPAPPAANLVPASSGPGLRPRGNHSRTGGTTPPTRGNGAQPPTIHDLRDTRGTDHSDGSETAEAHSDDAATRRAGTTGTSISGTAATEPTSGLRVEPHPSPSGLPQDASPMAAPAEPASPISAPAQAAPAGLTPPAPGPSVATSGGSATAAVASPAPASPGTAAPVNPAAPPFTPPHAQPVASAAEALAVPSTPAARTQTPHPSAEPEVRLHPQGPTAPGPLIPGPSIPGLTMPAPTPAAPSMISPSAAGTAPAPPGISPAESLGSPAPSSPAVRLPAHARPEDLRAIVEVPRGEYDARFALVVGLLFTVLTSVVLVVVFGRFVGGAEWFSTSAATADAADAAGITGSVATAHTGTSPERIGLATSTLLVALGAVLFLAGAAMAALEVRARQRREAPAATLVQGPAGSLRVLPAILDRASEIRATVATMTAGGVIALLGWVGQIYWGALF